MEDLVQHNWKMLATITQYLKQKVWRKEASGKEATATNTY